MKARFLAAIAVIATALVVIGSAAAFDCIRVSSSWQGLQQSTQSGNWLAFNMSSPAAVSQTFQTIFGAPVPDEVATCVADAYATYNVSPYFALGVGVAGGRTGNGVGVIAWNNKNTVVFGNLRGIDHLDDSPIGQALFGSLESCGISVE